MVRNSSHRRYCFTLNNYTPVEVETVEEHLNSDIVQYGVFGFEVGEHGTPHLQGFVIYKGPKRFNAARGFFVRSHVESARSTSDRCREYCIKDGNFREFGTFPDNQGSRSDLASVKQWALDYILANGHAPSVRTVTRDHFEYVVRYPRLTEAIGNLAPAPILQVGELRAWQQDLKEHLEEPADDRSVVFYVDRVGNQGKSWFTRWMFSYLPDEVQMMSAGKLVDMAYCVDPEKSIFLFDVPRGQMDYLQYAIFEQLKNRVVFSTKYQPMNKIMLKNTHVIVFCNEHPDMAKMSVDRYIIRNIN
jgi:Putative viral replication protein